MRKSMIDELVKDCLESKALRVLPKVIAQPIVGFNDIKLLFDLAHKHCGVSPFYELVEAGDKIYFDSDNKRLLVPTSPTNYQLAGAAYLVLSNVVAQEYGERNWGILNNPDKVPIWVALSGFKDVLKHIDELEYSDFLLAYNDDRKKLEPLLAEHDEQCNNPLCFVHTVLIPGLDNALQERLRLPTVTKYNHEELLYMLQLLPEPQNTHLH